MDVQIVIPEYSGVKFNSGVCNIGPGFSHYFCLPLSPISSFVGQFVHCSEILTTFIA